jgi:adenylate kinase
LIIFVGLAGSGKSVQGKLLAKEMNAQYFSMGEFLRQHVDPVIKEKMVTGVLISDEEVIEVVNDELSKVRESADKEYILDGFPRTLKQAHWLIKEVKKGRFHIRGVIYLIADKTVIIPRLLDRKRPDDNLETISRRMEEYNSLTLPILDYFKEAKVKVYEVDAEKDIETVHRDIMNCLELKS